MSWHQLTSRVLVELQDGAETGYRIMKFGLCEPYRFETWFGEKIIGICDNAEEAKQIREAHAPRCESGCQPK